MQDLFKKRKKQTDDILQKTTTLKAGNNIILITIIKKIRSAMPNGFCGFYYFIVFVQFLN